MSLFTVILEYDGGTYISQIEAEDVGAAVRAWADRVAAGAIPELPSNVGPMFARELSEEVPVPITGLSGVWCCTAAVRGRLGLVNVVRTAVE